MARQLRIHVPGGFYHVTLRGNHQQDIFFTVEDRQLLNIIVARAIEKFGARLHAYCWMQNHVHLLMQVGTEALAHPMRQIASEFARAMQIKLQTTGHFFERRHHATLVDVDSYLLELLRYIHLNPVRAGIVSDPAQYPWSSHHAYVGARSEPWITTEFGLRMFAPTRARAITAYLSFLGAPAAQAWATALERGDTVLGSEPFIERLQTQFPDARPRQTLLALIEEACLRFDVNEDRLRAPIRDRYLTKVRGWIAHQARQRGIATRSEVARALGRSEATLRYAIQTYPKELE